MSSPETRPQKNLTLAFTQRSLRMILVLVLLVVVGHAWSVGRLIRNQACNAVLAQARACAAALSPGPDGDLSASVSRLAAHFDRLIAVGELSAAGRLDHAYPDTPAHRAVVAAMLVPPVRPVRLSLGETPDVAGAIVSLTPDESPAARHVVILLRNEPYRKAMALSMVVVGLLVVMVSVSGTWLIRRWLARGVAQPLQQIARFASDNPDGEGRYAPAVTPPANAPLEIAQVADGLLRRIADAEARVRKLQQEAQDRLRLCEEGFDRRLRRVRDLAEMDVLTRVRNRNFLEDGLQRLFERHMRTRRDLAAVMIDIDNFKHFNDRCGHPAGDAVLRFVGTLLAGHLRPDDYAVRFGGDEFLLLLPGAGAEDARAIARRLVTLFAQYARQFGPEHQLSLSAGVAALHRDKPRTGHALVARADAALYEAKRTGKNNVAAFATA